MTGQQGRKPGRAGATIDYTVPATPEPVDRLLDLDRRYETVSGRSGLLYAYGPEGGVKRYVFGDGTVKTSRRAAIRYLEGLLDGLRRNSAKSA